MSSGLEDGEVTADRDNFTAFSEAVELACQAEVKRVLDTARSSADARTGLADELSGILDELVDEVAEGFQEKVREASLAGKTSAELYYFDGSAKFKDTDYSILFLTKGPKTHQQNHFIRLGVLPFLGKLYAKVHPFDVDMQYFPESNENIVSICWKSRR